MKPSDPPAPLRETRFYWVCHQLVRGFAATYLQWKVHHPERIPATGPVVLAANHVSFGDPPLIGAAVPRAVSFLARESLFESPAFGRLIRALNAVPVDRDGGGPSGLRTVLGLLEQNHAVLLFPEGTRSADGQLQPARSGIGLVVIRSGAPVVPVRVFGLFEAWGRQRRLPKPWPITIKFGQPLHFNALRAKAASASKPCAKAIYEHVAHEIMNTISRLEPCRDITRFG